MKKIIFILIFFTEFALPQDHVNLPRYFYKRMEGKINDSLNIRMNIIRLDSVLEGNYFYEKTGEPSDFGYNSYMNEDGKIKIKEEGGYDNNFLSAGLFDGNFTSIDEIQGKWINKDSTDIFNFYLKENYPEGSARFDIKNLQGDYGKSGVSDYGVSVELSYPVMISYTDKNVEDNINSYIINYYLNSSMEGDNGYSNLEDRVNSFIEGYQQEIEADSDLYKDYKPAYEDNEYTSIAFNSDYILSLEIIEFIYTGGAHGNSSFSLSSFNLHTGEKIRLEDIFRGDYKKVLNEAGEKIFRKNYQADSVQSLYEQGFFGFEKGFTLNNNFDIYKEGIKFQYNPYEAGAYALGAPEVFIPWGEIKDIIRDDSIVWKMLNGEDQSR